MTWVLPFQVFLCPDPKWNARDVHVPLRESAEIITVTETKLRVNVLLDTETVCFGEAHCS